MFELIRSHQRWLQALLLLLILPSFAFVGIQGYSSFMEGDHSLAKVAGGKVLQQEYDNAARAQLDQMRSMMGAQFDARTFDTPEAHKAILDQLINTRVIAAEVEKANFSATDNQLRDTIQAIPALQEDGKFSPSRYRDALAAQGMTPAGFAVQLRHDLAMQTVLAPVAQSVITPKSVLDGLVASATQRRDVQTLGFNVADYQSKVSVTDAEIKSFYDANSHNFTVSEHVDAQYVVLDQKAVTSSINVSDADIKSFYDQNQARYTQPEERRASHILITVDSKASAADRETARKKAEALLAQAKAPSADFAKLARENSQDTGTAANGGDLDWFGHGMMVKPFEDAAFALKDGEISNVIPTEYGFHIIKLTGIHPAVVKPLAQVHDDIANEIRQQLAAKQFADSAEQFTNLVYEQSDTLDPAASKFGLKIEQAKGVTRTPSPQAGDVFNNPKVIEALFSDEVLREKRNSGVIELAPNRLVAVRMVKHDPASVSPLSAVSDGIRKQLVQDKAATLAREAGEARLKALQAADSTVGFGPVVTVARTAPQSVSPEIVNAVMKASTDKLPTFVGVSVGGSYFIARVSRIEAGPVQTESALANEKSILDRRWSQAEQLAVLQTLRDKEKVQLTEDGTRLITKQAEPQ